MRDTLYSEKFWKVHYLKNEINRSLEDLLDNNLTIAFHFLYEEKLLSAMDLKMHNRTRKKEEKGFSNFVKLKLLFEIE